MSLFSRAPVGVGLMFATNGALFASVLPWYPTLKQQWELSDLAFGFMVAAFAIGGLASTSLPSALVSRYGPRRVVMAGTFLLSTLLFLVGWAPAAVFLALLLALFGLIDAVVDVSQNVAAVRVEHSLGRSIISSMHAFWSLGAVAGAGLATGAISSGMDIRLHLSLVATGVLAIIAVSCWLVGPITPEAVVAHKGKIQWKIALPVLIPVALVAISGTMVEDIAQNWSSLASVELAGAALSQAGIAYTIVIAAQCVGRFSGDWCIDRLGRVLVARSGGLMVMLGGVAMVLAPSVYVYYLGCALIGLGCATLVPSAFAAAAKLAGMSEGAGVTAVSWLMRLSFLLTSPVVGGISQTWSLQAALGLLLLTGAVAFTLAGALRYEPRK